MESRHKPRPLGLGYLTPLTYASEGMRYAMVPPVVIAGHTVTVPTLDMHWVLLARCGTIVVFFFFGTRTFRRRVVS